MTEYVKALWIRGTEADIVNIPLDKIFKEVDYGVILKTVHCPQKNLSVADLPYGLKAYHDKDGGFRENADIHRFEFHALNSHFEFGGNIIVIGEENGKRVGLSDYQIESIKNKQLITVGHVGQVKRA